jgi:outer membrane protein assembly factor BamB
MIDAIAKPALKPYLRNFTGGLVCLAVFCAFNPARAEDWPAYMHDNYRSGVTSEALDLAQLNQGWVYTSPAPPRLAWDNDHPWDSYAESLQVPMRDFDTALFVTVVGDYVYFDSSVTDSVHCLKAGTGNQQWFFTTNGPVRCPPSYYDNKLYFSSDDGYVYCISAADGSLVWKYSPTGQTRLMGNNGSLIPMWPVRTGTAVLDGKVYFAASLVPWQSSYLCAIDATTGSSSGPGLYVVSGGPTPMSVILASTSKIYLAQGRRYPYVFNRSNGSLFGYIGGEAGNGGCYVLLTSDTGYAYAHGQDHGSGYLAEEYVDYVATYPGARCMVVSGQTAYVVTQQFTVDKTKNDKTVINPQLKAINRSNGNTIWSAPCDSPYYSLIVAGTVIFAGGTNKVTAHNTANGSELWSKSVQGRARGLAAANGRLYVSTDTGKIYMFGQTDVTGDFNNDGIVNLKDLATFVSEYLQCTDPTNSQQPCVDLLGP